MELKGLPRWLSSEESACQSRRQVFDPWVGKIPWRRKWQPTPVFLPKNLMIEELDGPQSMGSQRAGHNLVTKQHQQHGVKKMKGVEFSMSST